MESCTVVLPMLTNRRIERVIDAAWLRVGQPFNQYVDPISMNDYTDWDFETIGVKCVNVNPSGRAPLGWFL